MGLRINTNVPAEVAQRALEQTGRAQSKTLQKLSTGKRIVQSGDDAAGLAIATNLNAQVKGMRQAQRNANDAISLVQVAEGSMNEVSNILTRLRELGIQAASDTIGNAERGFINQEVQEMKAEIERIAQTTSFNGRTLVNGEGGGELSFHVGIYGTENDRILFDSNKMNITTGSLGVDGIDMADKDDAADSLSTIDEALQTVSAQRAELGAKQNRIQSSFENLGVAAENLQTAKSRIMDADVGREASELAKQNVLQAAGTAVLAQANSTPGNALKLL